MPAKKNYPIGVQFTNFLNDREWMIVILTLNRDRSPEARRLAKKLLAKTKHGRQIRLLKLIQRRPPCMNDITKVMKVSRRTIFRDLDSLRNYGVKLVINDDYRYEAIRLPKIFKKLR